MISEELQSLDTDDNGASSKTKTGTDGRTAGEGAKLASGGRVNRPIPGDIGDKVNSFRLCGLVVDTAKRIKSRAHRLGEDLQLSSVIATVLRAYRASAAEEQMHIPGAEPSLRILKGLSDQILKDQIRRRVIAREKLRPAPSANSSLSGEGGGAHKGEAHRY
jgi:hypothetical protein